MSGMFSFNGSDRLGKIGGSNCIVFKDNGIITNVNIFTWGMEDDILDF
jgi:hypothetical protein